MRRVTIALIPIMLLLGSCADPGSVGDGGDPTTTTIDPDTPVTSDGDEPIGGPTPVGEVPQPRPPIDGNIDGEVWITSTDLRIMESYPIQVMMDVSGEKPSPCHEIFWTAEDTGDAIEVVMISQVASDATCAQVIEPFAIAVPLGSWAGEDREVRLNGEIVGSFQG